jgi:hypothetical protein
MKEILNFKEPTTIYIVGHNAENTNSVDFSLTDDYCNITVKINRDSEHKTICPMMDCDGYISVITDKDEFLEIIERAIEYAGFCQDIQIIENFQGSVNIVGISAETDITKEHLSYLDDECYTFDKNEYSIWDDNYFYLLLEPTTDEPFTSYYIASETPKEEILQVLDKL